MKPTCCKMTSPTWAIRLPLFIFVCLKYFRLSQFLIVSGTSDHLFGAMKYMVHIPYFTELEFLLYISNGISKIIRDSLIDLRCQNAWR